MVRCTMHQFGVACFLRGSWIAWELDCVTSCTRLGRHGTCMCTGLVQVAVTIYRELGRTTGVQRASSGGNPPMPINLEVSMKSTIAGGTITYTFEGLEPLVFNTTLVSGTVWSMAAVDRLHNRCKDMAAIERQQRDGTVITVTERMRRDAVKAGIDHYESGTVEWNLKGGTRPAPQNAAILAIAAKMGKTYEETEAFLANADIQAMMAGMSKS